MRQKEVGKGGKKGVISGSNSHILVCYVVINLVINVVIDSNI